MFKRRGSFKPGKAWRFVQGRRSSAGSFKVAAATDSLHPPPNNETTGIGRLKDCHIANASNAPNASSKQKGEAANPGKPQCYAASATPQLLTTSPSWPRSPRWPPHFKKSPSRKNNPNYRPLRTTLKQTNPLTASAAPPQQKNGSAAPVFKRSGSSKPGAVWRFVQGRRSSAGSFKVASIRFVENKETAGIGRPQACQDRQRPKRHQRQPQAERRSRKPRKTPALRRIRDTPIVNNIAKLAKIAKMASTF